MGISNQEVDMAQFIAVKKICIFLFRDQHAALLLRTPKPTHDVSRVQTDPRSAPSEKPRSSSFQQSCSCWLGHVASSASPVSDCYYTSHISGAHTLQQTHCPHFIMDSCSELPQRSTSILNLYYSFSYAW